MKISAFKCEMYLTLYLQAMKYTPLLGLWPKQKEKKTNFQERDNTNIVSGLLRECKAQQTKEDPINPNDGGNLRCSANAHNTLSVWVAFR